VNLKIFIPRKHENIKTRNSIKKFCFLIFSCSRGACAARPLFRVFVVNPFFLDTYKLGCLAMHILLVRFAKKTLILRPCFDIKKASTEKEEAC